MYRGTILELVPGDHVDLLLPSGTTRRFPSASVLNAGPATTPTAPEAPPAATSSTGTTTIGSASPSGVRLRVTAPRPGFTLLLQTDSAGIAGVGTLVIAAYERLCTAPCETVLPRGNHRFAVEDPRGTQEVTSRPVLVASEGTLRIARHSRRAARLGFAAGMLASLGVGTALTVYGARHKVCTDIPATGETECRVDWTYAGPGAGLLALGVGFAFGTGMMRDQHRVEFVADR